MNVIAFVAIFLFLPETKERTLVLWPRSSILSRDRSLTIFQEELDYVFAVSTRKHAKFQATEALPWFFRRWVFFDKTAVEPELYSLKTDVKF